MGEEAAKADQNERLGVLEGQRRQCVSRLLKEAAQGEAASSSGGVGKAEAEVKAEASTEAKTEVKAGPSKEVAEAEAEAASLAEVLKEAKEVLKKAEAAVVKVEHEVKSEAVKAAAKSLIEQCNSKNSLNSRN